MTIPSVQLLRPKPQSSTTPKTSRDALIQSPELEKSQNDTSIWSSYLTPDYTPGTQNSKYPSLNGLDGSNECILSPVCALVCAGMDRFWTCRLGCAHKCAGGPLPYNLEPGKGKERWWDVSRGSIRLFGFLSLSCMSSLYSGYHSVSDVIQKYSLLFCGLPFPSVDSVLWGTKVFNFGEVKLIYFFFCFLCF